MRVVVALIKDYVFERVVLQLLNLREVFKIMKALKVIGLIILILVLLAAGGLGLICLGVLDFYAGDRSNTDLTNFDCDRIEVYDAWLRDDLGEPDMRLPLEDGDIPIYDADGMPLETLIRDGRIVVYDYDLKDYVELEMEGLPEGRPYYELFGVDPEVDLFAEGVHTISFKCANYLIDTLVGHAFCYYRGLDTGRLDFHMSAQEFTQGFVGNYEQKTVWSYFQPEKPDSKIVPYVDETHEKYLADEAFEVLEYLKHWDGEGDIVLYSPWNSYKLFLYDIELNPELDDELFTAEGLERYKGLEFYKDLQ